MGYTFKMLFRSKGCAGVDHLCKSMQVGILGTACVFAKRECGDVNDIVTSLGTHDRLPPASQGQILTTVVKITAFRIQQRRRNMLNV